MKIKKVYLSTMLSDLYGRDNYQSHIEVDREYWYYFGSESTVGQKLGYGWYKIKVTFIRSGCFFYILSDYPKFKEEYASVNSFFGGALLYAEIDPAKDLGDKLGNIEVAKMKYCFDDEHTIVKNWPNEREIEVDKDELYKKFGNSDDEDLLMEYLTLLILLKNEN